MKLLTSPVLNFTQHYPSRKMIFSVAPLVPDLLDRGSTVNLFSRFPVSFFSLRVVAGFRLWSRDFVPVRLIILILDTIKGQVTMVNKQIENVTSK